MPLKKRDPIKPVINEARRTLLDILTLGIPRKIAEAMVAKQIERGLKDAAELIDSEGRTSNLKEKKG